MPDDTGKGALDADNIVQKPFTLPETTRASFGPTVWQFPILAAQKTYVHNRSSHTTVSWLLKRVPKQDSIFDGFPSLASRAREGCVTLIVTKGYTSAFPFQNKIHVAMGHFRWQHLLYFENNLVSFSGNLT